MLAPVACGPAPGAHNGRLAPQRDTAAKLVTNHGITIGKWKEIHWNMGNSRENHGKTLEKEKMIGKPQENGDPKGSVRIYGFCKGFTRDIMAI